jgi:hypothetical protein
MNGATCGPRLVRRVERPVLPARTPCATPVHVHRKLVKTSELAVSMTPYLDESYFDWGIRNAAIVAQVR